MCFYHSACHVFITIRFMFGTRSSQPSFETSLERRCSERMLVLQTTIHPLQQVSIGKLGGARPKQVHICQGMMFPRTKGSRAFRTCVLILRTPAWLQLNAPRQWPLSNGQIQTGPTANFRELGFSCLITTVPQRGTPKGDPSKTTFE